MVRHIVGWTHSWMDMHGWIYIRGNIVMWTHSWEKHEVETQLDGHMVGWKHSWVDTLLGGHTPGGHIVRGYMAWWPQSWALGVPTIR